jgi:FMN phosphatase YigB (HAD superfamily)
MFAWVGLLRTKGYRTALMSNTEGPCVERFRELRYDVFDLCLFSCVEGVTKPHRRIYDLAIGRLGISPGAAVFIDDNPLFVAGAQEAGLHGVVFHDQFDLTQRLAELGVR